MTCGRFVDGQSGETSPELNISGFESASWPRTGNKPGTIFTGTVSIPDTISPGAVSVRYAGKAPDAKAPDSNRVRRPDSKVCNIGCLAGDRPLWLQSPC